MLSSQTKDQITYDAMKRLKQHGLTPENMVKSLPSVLEQLIIPVSFYRVTFLIILFLFDGFVKS